MKRCFWIKCFKL